MNSLKNVSIVWLSDCTSGQMPSSRARRVSHLGSLAWTFLLTRVNVQNHSQWVLVKKVLKGEFTKKSLTACVTRIKIRVKLKRNRLQSSQNVTKTLSYKSSWCVISFSSRPHRRLLSQITRLQRLKDLIICPSKRVLILRLRIWWKSSTKVFCSNKILIWQEMICRRRMSKHKKKKMSSNNNLTIIEIK